MYTPINTQLFTAVFTGALSGMLAANRIQVNTSQSLYDHSCAVAGAFAQEIDILWNSTSITTLQYENFLLLSKGEWNNRGINGEYAIEPDFYETTAEAIIAIVKSSDSFYTANGITPPPIGGGAQILRGTYEAMPVPSTALLNVLYFTTNGHVSYLCDGTQWVPLFNGLGFSAIPPLASTFTSLNGLPAVTDSHGAIGFQGVSSGVVTFQGAFTSQADLTKSAYAAFAMNVPPQVAGPGEFAAIGLFARDSNRNFICSVNLTGSFDKGSVSLEYQEWSNFTNRGKSDTQLFNGTAGNGAVFLRINRLSGPPVSYSFEASSDGTNWQVAGGRITDASTFLPDQYGVETMSLNVISGGYLLAGKFNAP